MNEYLPETSRNKVAKSPAAEARILWNGNEVGKIRDYRFDHFAIYGKWQAASTEIARQLMMELKNGADIQVLVNLTLSITAHVSSDSFSDDQIEIRFVKASSL
ncbi:MAG: hypothetical protein IPK19_15090 [Chloroflexi bacterium]|nr:hypothetical protein [Chloroflexota bacterium]